MSMESCQTQTCIHIDSPSIGDDSDDEASEILSNLHPALIKDFLSHLEMRMHRMSFSLTRNDQFFVDQLITFIHIPSYSEHPVHILMSCLGMN